MGAVRTISLGLLWAAGIYAFIGAYTNPYWNADGKVFLLLLALYPATMFLANAVRGGE